MRQRRSRLPSPVTIAGSVLAAFTLSTTTIAFQDAAALAGSKWEGEVRWLSYVAPAAPRPTVEFATLDSFDSSFPDQSPDDGAFVVAEANSIPEDDVDAEQSSLRHTILPPSLASRFAFAQAPIIERIDTMTGIGVYAEGSPDSAPTDQTIPDDAAADGSTPGTLTLASLTPSSSETPLEIAAMPVAPGTATVLAALPSDPISSPVQETLDKDMARAKKCLSEAVYFEARGEPLKGQYAVAQVVMNRTRSGYYPDNVCAVVYENKNRRNQCQFSFACDGIPDRIYDRQSWAIAQRVADDVLVKGTYLPDVGTATHYHATYVRPYWIRDMVKEARLGRHIFYRVRNWTGEGV
ncbi:cell wall hydrolase [Flaviflagellibacter deserti]|uniref:Cell wall hydrolase n=1 Tax=Flaviflagellibacter deserti TaxID=2267266 RepID=A0ABV9YWP1_9HYPH